jgi:hypothetical protein
LNKTISNLNNLFLSSLFSLFLIIGVAQSPSLQPLSGPGGSAYLHSDVVMSDFTSIWTADEYWLFEPDSPKPDAADVIVFNHGYGVLTQDLMDNG